MKEMIEHVVKALVDHPDEVKVTELAGERTLTYEIKVVQGDQGKIIGRKGHTIDALRAIVRAAARKVNKHATVDLID
jgi:predicted RNA-binding protein YlqC (UPF0109 family)